MARSRLPAVYPAREFVDAGGLVAYAVNYPDLYFRFARFVDKIFKGEKPGDLPVEQPTKFELVINANTAKMLGLTIPPVDQSPYTSMSKVAPPLPARLSASV